MASPPFSIQTTLPSSTDLASQFPTVEHLFRDTVNSWLQVISDPATGKVKASALPTDYHFTGSVVFDNVPTIGSDPVTAIPSGYSMVFRNSTAPTGWTKRTDQNDKAFRVVSGTPVDGGSVAFSTAFATGVTISGTTGATTVSGTVGFTAAGGTVGFHYLTESEIPSHQHYYSNYTQFAGDHTHVALKAVIAGGSYNTLANGAVNTASNVADAGIIQTAGSHQHLAQGYTYATGGGGAHDHTFTGSSHNHTFTGASHTHTFSGSAAAMNLAYIDVIIATKD